MVQSPWAVLLCKFKDNASEPYPRQRFDELFTSAGSGKFNMVDFFKDMSHGSLDLSGSQVFDWITLEQNLSDYKALTGTNNQNRGKLLEWVRTAAKAAGIELNGWMGPLAIFNVPTDLFGGGDGVVSDDGRDIDGTSSLSPSVLGQEMGHFYGLNHSRTDGSAADYTDAWDVMSTRGPALMGPHPFFTELDVRARPIFVVGPGLNAANMYGRGWLDLGRVWNADEQEFGSRLTLRPLHRRDLAGYLAARVGQYFIEFRMPELWDNGIGQPVVLVHDYFNGNSYLHSSTTGSQGMTVGDKFQIGEGSDVLAAFLQVSVVDINSNDRTATLEVVRHRDRHPVAGPAQIFGGVAVDGGGLVFVNGKVRRVPPRSPLVAMLEDFTELLDSEEIRHPMARGMVQQQALQNLSARATEQMEQLTGFHTPAPAMMQQLTEGSGNGNTTDLSPALTKNGGSNEDEYS